MRKLAQMRRCSAQNMKAQRLIALQHLSGAQQRITEQRVTGACLLART